MDPSQTSFVQLPSIGTKMVGPGASEIVLDPSTVALVDGASVFILSAIFQEVGTFHLAFDTNAFTLSSTGDVAPDSEASIEDLLFPNVGSMSDVPNDIAFYVDARVVASTEGSKMDQLCPWIRQPIWHTGAMWPSLWTKAPFGTW